MVLGEISQNNPQIRQTPVKQRVVSESTGLMKFNINSNSTPSKSEAYCNGDSKSQQNQLQLNHEDGFLSSSSPTHNHTAAAINRTSMVSPKRGIQVIPNKMIKPTISVTDSGPSNIASSRNYQQNSRSRTNSQVSVSSADIIQSAQGFSNNQDIYLQLAAKQREVLELKLQMQNLKDKLIYAESELKDIEKLCGERSSQIPMNIAQQSHSNQSTFNNGNGLLGRSNSTIKSVQNRNSLSNLLSSVSLSKNSSQSTLTPTPEEPASNAFNFQNLKKRISIAQFPTTSLNKLQQDTESFFGKGLEFMNTIKDEVFRELNSEDEEDGSQKSDSSDQSLLLDTERGTFISKSNNHSTNSNLNRMRSLRFGAEPKTNSNGRVKYAQEIDYESDEGEDMDVSEGNSSMLSEYGGADVSDFTLAVK